MIILYDNEIYNADAITGTIDSDDPLIDPRLSSVAVTTGKSSQYIVFDHHTSGAVDVTYACLLGSNLTTGATVKLEGNSSDSWTTPAWSLTLTSAGNGTFIGHVDTAVSYTYYRLTITDAGNTNTYLTIPWFFYGMQLTMPGMDTGMSIPRTSTAIATKTATGQLYGSKRLRLKSAKIAFSDITQANKVLINTFEDYCDITHPFIVLVWEDDLTVEPPRFVALSELPEWTRSKNPGLLWNMTMNMEECC